MLQCLLLLVYGGLYGAAFWTPLDRQEGHWQRPLLVQLLRFRVHCLTRFEDASNRHTISYSRTSPFLSSYRALRLLRLSLLSGNLSTMKSNKGALISGSLNVPLVWLVASVVAWMFTSASCVAVMEKWVWHDALYFVASTLTTVGYGDVVVKSSMGEQVVVAAQPQ
jgi:hypothetical protein